MRKRVIALAACLGVLATVLQVLPANAVWDWGSKAPQGAQVWDWGTQKVAATERGDKMGALPLHYKICVANGIAGYNTEWTLEHWTQLSYGALNLVVAGNCVTAGYSVTNRMTVDTYVDAAGGCGKFTRLERYWDGQQGKYIYNNNPVVWLNVRDSCVPNDTAYAHRLTMYVGYILGLNYGGTCYYYVMCQDTQAVNGVKYVTTKDRSDMAKVFGLAA